MKPQHAAGAFTDEQSLAGLTHRTQQETDPAALPTVAAVLHGWPPLTDAQVASVRGALRGGGQRG